MDTHPLDMGPAGGEYSGGMGTPSGSHQNMYSWQVGSLLECFLVTTVIKCVLFIVTRITEMSPSPILSIIHKINIDTMLNFNSGRVKTSHVN